MFGFDKQKTTVDYKKKTSSQMTCKEKLSLTVIVKVPYLDGSLGAKLEFTQFRYFPDISKYMFQVLSHSVTHAKTEA